MLKSLVRCAEYSALASSVICIWEDHPVYAIWFVLMAIVFMYIGDKLEK